MVSNELGYAKNGCDWMILDFSHHVCSVVFTFVLISKANKADRVDYLEERINNWADIEWPSGRYCNYEWSDNNKLSSLVIIQNANAHDFDEVYPFLTYLYQM